MNMNPMGMMGMNNQLMTNFTMDETAMKIKAIIEPYEKKITELENIIKQKVMIRTIQTIPIILGE